MKIIVETDEEKTELLAALEHIHYCDVDTDIPMVNTIAHLYLRPDLIEVRSKTKIPEYTPPPPTKQVIG